MKTIVWNIAVLLTAIVIGAGSAITLGLWVYPDRHWEPAPAKVLPPVKHLKPAKPFKYRDPPIPVIADVQWELASMIGYTIWLEARSETDQGRRAVATVIWNRAGGNPAKFHKVLAADAQFSCWDNRAPCRPSVAIESLGRYQICLGIGVEMVLGTFRPLADWNHYYNPRKCRPYWRRDMEDRRKVGNHVFGTI